MILYKILKEIFIGELCISMAFSSFESLPFHGFDPKMIVWVSFVSVEFKRSIDFNFMCSQRRISC